MKKIKKMLAGLLGAAMVLTSFGTPAWATPTNPETTNATIDTTKKGSITIHKYEYNGDLTLDNNGKYNGTGEVTNNLPKKGEFGADADAKPLAGAGFTIYKVVDATEIENYYSKNPNGLPDVSIYIQNGKISSSYSNKVVKLDDNGAASASGNKEELITGADGTASFTNLDVGFYVVIETKTPDKVTTPAEPFIVSVPMTKADGSDWLYDVHVYPKNKTTYGNVKLVKTGNGTEKLEGVTFVLQKQTGTNPISWTNITASEQNPNDTYTLTTNTDGMISISGLSQGTYRFIETNRGDKNNGYIMDGATTYSFVVKEDGKTYNAGGTELLENNTITVDNKKPDMIKEVKDRKTSDWQQDSDYNVGDKVPYKVTIDVPENITKLKYFTLKDTPTNLKDDKATIKVQYKDKNAADTTLLDVTNASGPVYSVTQNEGENGFLVTFTPSNMDAYAGKQIVITYSAELRASADKTTIGNPNTARLEYSNSIVPDTADTDNPNPQGSEPKHDSIEDTAIVYYFAVNIHKTDNVNAPLKDVEFDLYKKVADGVSGAVTVNGIDGKCVKINTNSLKTGTDGNVTQGGLANGEYYLVETKTNEGYNLLKSPVKVDLNIQYKTTFTEKNEWIWENDATTGGKILVKHTVKQTTYTEGTQGNSTTLTDGTHTETIINRKGFTLPKTGDIGTAMFLIIGIGGMLAAVYIMLRGRKRA